MGRLSQIYSHSLSLRLSFGLGLWLAEPETLGNVGMNMFPELGVSDVGKSIELRDLGLDLRGLYWVFDNLGMCTYGLGRNCRKLTYQFPLMNFLVFL